MPEALAGQAQTSPDPGRPRCRWCLPGPYLSRLADVPYPPRPQLRPLPEFTGTRDSAPPRLQAWLEAFIVGQYAEGRSLREIAELTDRSQTAVRRALDKHQVPRRPPGARPLAEQ